MELHEIMLSMWGSFTFPSVVQSCPLPPPPPPSRCCQHLWRSYSAKYTSNHCNYFFKGKMGLSHWRIWGRLAVAVVPFKQPITEPAETEPSLSEREGSPPTWHFRLGGFYLCCRKQVPTLTSYPMVITSKKQTKGQWKAAQFLWLVKKTSCRSWCS